MGRDDDASLTGSDARLAPCQELLGHVFADPALLRLALTHASAKAAGLPSNERLEFLGDAVLGCIISEHLYRLMPDAAEGDLTRTRSLVVSSRALARACRAAGLHEYLTLGKGIRAAKSLPQSLLANAMEAVLGAVYLDAGLERVRTVALVLLAAEIEQALAGNGQRNFKALLQHLAQTELRATPTYRVVAEEGPAHTRTFAVVAVIGKRQFPEARGRSKKSAEQAAARKAWTVLTTERAAEGGRVAERPAVRRRPTRRTGPKASAGGERTEKPAGTAEPEAAPSGRRSAKPA